MTQVATSAVAQHRDTSGRNLVFDSGRGHLVRDVTGKDYIDFVCGFGPVVIGHADPDWTTAFTSGLASGIHLPGYAEIHDRYAAHILADLSAPRSVAYFKHSSDSVTAAVRLSGTRTGRPSFIRCGYIGWHDAQIANSPRWHEPPSSPLRGEVRYTSGFRGVSGPEAPYDWVDLDLGTLSRALESGRYSCFVIDAYQASFCPPEVPARAAEMCRTAGVSVVLDETKTAGRISTLGWLSDLHDIADYIVCGKAIANGVALSVLVGPPEMSEELGSARVSGTFSKDLLSVHAALATSETLAARGGFDRLHAVGHRIVTAFNTAAESRGASDLVGAEAVFGGAMWEISWGNSLLGEPQVRENLRRHCADMGLLLLQGHPSFTMLAHEDIDFEGLQKTLESALESWLSENRRRIDEL